MELTQAGEETLIPPTGEAGDALNIPDVKSEEFRRKWGRDRDVSLEELEGLPVLEQFLKIWGTPARGEILWDLWVRSQPETNRGFLDVMAQNLSETGGIPIEEARTRLAVEKFLNDQGGNVAANFVDSYKARKLMESRPLKPMALPRKRKK